MGLLKRHITKQALQEQDLLDNNDGRAPGLEELQQLIKKFSPLLCVHPDETCLPVDVDTYLEKAWLVNASGNIRILAAVKSLADLPANGTGYYLEPLEGENIVQEKHPLKTYVHAIAHNQFYTDLQYWFFYAGTCCASAAVKWLIDGTITGYEGETSLSPLGELNGCWERITLRISNATRQPEQVFFPRSGNGTWLPIEEVQRRGHHVVAYVSKGNGALLPAPGLDCGKKISFNLYSSRLEFCLRQETTSGKEIDLSGYCELVSAPYLKEERPREPLWLNYRQHWGNPKPDYLATTSVKRIVMFTFGKNLEFLLSKDIFYELVNHLTQYFSEQCGRSLAPKARSCWEQEEAGEWF